MARSRALWCLIAAFLLVPALVHAQAPVQVPSKRAITGMPPLFESQPDREIPGRFVGFTASGCALSFSAASVRGLSWSGACSGGRMHGQGTVMGYDYEQQPIFIFEGFIDRGLRKSGVMYEVHRKDGVLIGLRTEIVGSALQPHTEVRFLDMPRPFLLALDDWNRQTDGKDLLASMGATWAPSPSASAAKARAFEQEQARKAEQDARETREAWGQLLGAIGQYQQNKADRRQAQQEERQRQLQAQQAQQQEQQRRMQDQQNSAYVAEAARAEAFNRESARATEQRAQQHSSPDNGNTTMGRPIQNNIGSNQPQRSASDPAPLHIVHQPGPKGLTAYYDLNKDQRAQEQRERERKHKENVKKYEEEVRRNQAERAEARRQRDAEAVRQQLELGQQHAIGRQAMVAGALAIDNNQGRQYGFAYDHPNAGQAEQRALSECGNGCRVVLRFNSGCAAYATDQSRGSTAYGWATSTSSAGAQGRALSECQSRGGKSCLVRTWGCNSR